MFVVAVIIAFWQGLGFKISAVPFHMWTPDINSARRRRSPYLWRQARKPPRLRCHQDAHPHAQFSYAVFAGIRILLAVLTMIVGNLIASPQKNIKRMQAYSSISHAGYILLGLNAFTDLGVTPCCIIFSFTLSQPGTLPRDCPFGHHGER
jgi:NADH-quinone oxidoreductase subunit N